MRDSWIGKATKEKSNKMAFNALKILYLDENVSRKKDTHTLTYMKVYRCGRVRSNILYKLCKTCFAGTHYRLA